jgi:starvation-inducible outer membrane lipoprotein
MTTITIALTAALLLSACSTAPHYCAEPYLSCQDRDGGKQIEHRR